MTATARVSPRSAPGLPPRRPGASPEARHVGRSARPRLRRLAVLTVLAVALVLVTFVYCQIQISQTAVARSAADARLADETARIESLRNEVAQLESPARIVAEARRLGFVTPERTEFLSVRRGS